MPETLNPYLLGTAQYRVIAPCIVARLAGGAEQYLYRDATLPASTLPSHVEHMIESGLVVKVEDIR